MKVVIKNMHINVRKFEELLNKELNKYNIKVNVYEEVTPKKQVLNIYAELIEPVKYSTLTSQIYDEKRIEFVERMGEFIRNPKLKFGIKMRYLHWYHWALLNDVITYILDNIGADYEIRSAVGKFKGWRTWRDQLTLDYYPQFDPAFLKRLSRPQTRFKGVPIYADREKMYDAIDKVDEALKYGDMKPSDLPELEEKILTYTRANTYYEGITVPESLSDTKPIYQAWFRYKYGRDADTMYYYMSEEEREKEWEELENWLENVNPESRKFKEFLGIWKEKIRDLINWASEQYGPFEEILEEKDDAGFPFGFAKKLRHEPYKPEISVEELKELTREKSSEYALQEVNA